MADLDWIFQRFDFFSKRTCLIHKNIEYSFSDLKKETLLWIDFFRQNKIGRGECVAFAGDYSIKTSSLLIALLINKNIAVPLRKNKNEIIEQYIENAYVSHFIDFKDDSEYAYKKIDRKKSHPILDELKKSKKAGLILYTSGSTGSPKAVLHDFDKLIAKYEKKRKPYSMIILLFIDHIGGINTLFRMLFSGGKIVISPAKRPDTVCRLIEKHKIEILPTSPSFLRMLLMSEAYKDFDLSSLKTISYGTEPMSEALLKKLTHIFPDIGFKQLYGLSELGILSLKSEQSDSTYIKFDTNKIGTKIVNNELWIKSPEAMLGYLNAPNPFNHGKLILS